MTLKEVEERVLAMLKAEFPGMTFYGNSVVEKMTRPCMFLQWRPVDMAPTNYNSRENKLSMHITYHQKVKSDSDVLEKADRIRDMFGLSFCVDDRAVKVENFDFNWNGQEQNIPQISIDLEWKDKINHPTDVPIMEHVGITNTIKEEI